MNKQPNSSDLKWITNYIWGIVGDVLRDLYAHRKYRGVIFTMTVLRRLNAVLENTKEGVLDTKAMLDNAGVVDQDLPFARQLVWPSTTAD